MAVFRVEKTKDYTVMSNHHLRNIKLSLKAKGLLSLMLSLPEGWDYSTKGLAKICKDGVDSICTGVNELERAGYVIRERQRNEGGKLGDIIYTIYEQPPTDSPKRENPVQDKPILGIPKQEKPEQENPAQLSIDILNTDLSNTKPVITYQSINHPRLSDNPTKRQLRSTDMIDEMDRYREIINMNIDYGHLVLHYNADRVDEVVQLMLDIICSGRDTEKVSGTDVPIAVIRNRFLKLGNQHISYVLDCLERNTTKIGNIRAYILTALYNSYSTVENYYRAEVTCRL